MDEDLETGSREPLLMDVQRLRGGSRTHRDASGHASCGYHPDLCYLRPESRSPDIRVPAQPRSMRGRVRDRWSLGPQAPDAPRGNVAFCPDREG